MRFFDPGRYNEDWYIELRGEYQKFFDYIIETCDNAGVWRPNKYDFETKTGFKINLDSFLTKVNGDKARILVLENKRWFIPEFVRFQFFNKKASFDLNEKHPFHKNILKSIKENNLQGLVKGLERVCQGVKDIDMDSNCIKDRGLGEGIFFPDEEDLKMEIPEMKIGAVIQYMAIAKQQQATADQILGLWEVFKKQNFTGKKPYNGSGDVYSHFINWCKEKKIEKSVENKADKYRNFKRAMGQ